ncbi:MAG: GNAT family N-acetyltransferase [Janthinobacterium lividum]
MYRVRSIESGDSDGLLTVWRETWTATYAASLGDTAIEAMLRDLDVRGVASMVPLESAQALCLLHDDEIIGSAIYSTDGPVAYLWGMYIKPHHQRSGAGALLLQSVQDGAGQRPIEVRVLRSSTHAKSFYRKHGFQSVGEELTEIMSGVEELCLIMIRSQR